jgi:hypothetical protein
VNETLTAIIGAIVLGVLTWIAKQVNQVNDAVNHRHKRKTSNGETPPKLYDLAIENHQKIVENHQRIDGLSEDLGELVEWKRSYDGGPMDNGVKVIEFHSETHERLGNLEETVTKIDKTLTVIETKLGSRPCLFDETCPEGYMKKPDDVDPAP